MRCKNIFCGNYKISHYIIEQNDGFIVSIKCNKCNNISKYKIPQKQTTHTKSSIHLPGYNYCGPGTDLYNQLKAHTIPKNDIDYYCRLHDVWYYLHPHDHDKRRTADKTLLYNLTNLKKRGSISSTIISAVMNAKRILVQ